MITSFIVVPSLYSIVDMAPKGGNAKKESGRAKKAENEAKKQQAAEVDRVRPNILYVVPRKLNGCTL